jgi:hypothetical protein
MDYRNRAMIIGRSFAADRASTAVRLVLVASFHRTIGLARRGSHRSFRADFFAPGGTSRIASQRIFARVEWPFFTRELFFTRVCFCFLFHKCPVLPVNRSFEHHRPSLFVTAEASSRSCGREQKC